MGASSFTWLDHSDRERRRVLEAIEQFKETDTRDELGLGTIRDAFADRFFPGTSVLQTRARYFLFVPWMYKAMEGRGAAPDAAFKGRRTEVGLIDVLLASDEPQGTIGRLARSSLKRLPSSLYWLGLERWGIREFRAGQDEYHALLARNGGGAAKVDDDGEPLADGAVRTWNPHLPPAPPDFPKKAQFALPKREAQFLVEQIRQRASGTLLDYLARRGKPADCNYAWEHPQFAELSDALKAELTHARFFAETMQGAMLIYNLMLTEERKSADRAERLAGLSALISDWSDEIRSHEPELRTWERRQFWTVVLGWANVRPATQRFVDGWLDLAPWRTDLASSLAARALVRARELQLKGARARMGNPRALELWGGLSGVGRLDYRWSTARRLLADIYDGIDGGDDDAGAA